MARKPHSPFRGATEQQLAALRACIVATQHWERALGTPEQYLERKLPMMVFDNLGFSVPLRVERAAIRRWEASAHYPQSRVVYDDQHMQKYNRRAWEVNQLRRELAAAEERWADLSAQLDTLMSECGERRA
ncbi:hypothetical protein [Microbacterium sp. 77mftsu3.1]|uniref:hypothetical protein n=1 Tax=Microbacterium sp. 77mftsu3.1 TaxID=1761802 RepID=UPI00035D6542|nr:hypothetical protein [Microbacterium sp. 77mftsu3.1]SDH48349.1 hypothetical protein SAMN04488590_3408 [Microbacterium sp. 77mftsu3.1]